MSDEDRRKRQREAEKDPGSAESRARQAAEDERATGALGLERYLNTFIGQWIYVEGVKMNYRGVLVGLAYYSGDGTQLLVTPCHRVGDWGDYPTEANEEVMTSTPDHPRAIPWGSVTEFGLMQAHWPKHGPKRDLRAR